MTLPDKPSELLTIALESLDEVKRDKRYVIDMASWHTPSGDVCYVCLAGAVMARKLNVPFNRYVLPSYFDDDTYAKLQGLDKIRDGRLRLAFNYMQIPINKLTAELEEKYESCNMPWYGYNSSLWRKKIKSLIKDLRKINL